MKVKDLIKELEKLPQDAEIGVWSDDDYEIQEPIIKNVNNKNETYLNNWDKENYKYFIDSIIG